MPRRIRGSEGLPIHADINITSMVDVAFTLLVIFIITAPILQGGMQVTMPEGNVSPLEPTEEPVYVSVDSEGQIFIEDAEMASFEEFQSTFEQLAASGRWTSVFLKQDEASSFGTFVRVQSAMERAGVRVQVVVQPMRDPN